MATKGMRNRKIEATEAQTVLDSVKSLDTSKVVSEVNNLQVSIQSTLADVSASITNKLQQIETINTAIKLKQERLKELYGIEAEAVKWDDIQAQHEADKVSWDKDVEAREAQWHNDDEAMRRLRAREEEEWQYNFDQKKFKAERDLMTQFAETKRQENLRQADLNKNWNERETALRTKEAEFTQLKDQVAGFDARLKTEASKAEAVLKNVLEKQFSHERALLQKDAESAKSVAELQVVSLKTVVEQQQKQIDDLRNQLMAARNDTMEVSKQALQASSDRKVADALRQVVDSRDQQTGKSK